VPRGERRQPQRAISATSLTDNGNMIREREIAGQESQPAEAVIAAQPAPGLHSKGPASVLKHAIVYGLGIAARPMVSFLMLPLYTHFIRSGDYGVYELMNRGGEFLGIFIFLAIPRAMMRIYALRDDRAYKHQVVTSALLFSGCWGLLLTGAFVAASGPLSQLLTKQPGYGHLFAIIMLSAWLDAGIQTPLSHMRAKEQSGWYTAINIARLAAAVSLNVYFVAVLHLGVAGIIYSSAIVTGGTWLLLVTKTLRETGLSVSRQAIVLMLRFGLPLSIGGLPVFVLHFADRFILAHYYSAADVGTYAVGYRLGMLVGMLVNDPFGLAYEPYSYAIERRPDAKQIYSRILTYHAVAGLLVFVGLSAFSRDIVRLMTAPDYFGAQWVVPWVALGYVFYGMSNTARLGLMLSQRTELTLPLNAAAAGCNIALNFALLPRFGIIGAAMATTFSFLALAIINYAVTYRVYPIPCEPVRLAKAVGAAIAIAAVIMLFPPRVLALRLIAATACAAAYPALLLVLGFFHKDETRAISRILARGLSALRSKAGEVIGA